MEYLMETWFKKQTPIRKEVEKIVAGFSEEEASGEYLPLAVVVGR